MLIPTPGKKSIYIFDIPLILDLICYHLTKNDLLSCLQVSHYWHDLFRLQILRYIRFADLKEHQTWAILDNAARIQFLTIDIADAGWLLDNPYSPCINLQILRCVDFGYLQPDYYGDYDYTLDYDNDGVSLEGNLGDPSTNALNLIQSNPKLATLDVTHGRQRYCTSHFTPTILISISKHQVLSQIKIELDVILPESFPVDFLLHLPPSLEDLSLSAMGIFRSSGTPAATAKLTLHGPTNLRRIVLQPCDIWFEDVEVDIEEESYIQRVVLPLIRNSPRLVDISLGRYNEEVVILLQTLADVCPLVETIDCEGYGCADNEVLTLNGSLSHLREFKLRGYYSGVNEEQRALVPIFLHRSSATLQVISISWESSRNGNEPPVRFTAWNFWLECPHLREYTFDIDFSYGRNEYHSLNTLVESLARPTVACRNLQKLEIWITDHAGLGECSRYRQRSSTSQGIFRHQQSFLQLVQPFYHYLRTFKKLDQQNLRIHWGTCSSIKAMSMEEAILGINGYSFLGKELYPTLSTHSNSHSSTVFTSKTKEDFSSPPLRQPEILERDLKWIGIDKLWYSGQELQLKAEEIANETKLRNGRYQIWDRNYGTPWARDYKRVGCGWKDWKCQAGLHGCSPYLGPGRGRTSCYFGPERGRPANCQCPQCLHEVPNGLDGGLDRFLSGEDIKVERGHRRRNLQRCRRKHIK